MIGIYLLIKYYSDYSNNLIPSYVYFAAGLLFATYPLLMRVGDSKNVAASARPLGEFLVVLAILFAILFTLEHNIIYLLLSIFSGALVLLSSKFGMQAWLFLSIILSLFQWNITFILIVLASYLVAIILSWGGYLRVLNGHIAHSNFMMRVRYRAGLGYKLLLKLPKMIFENPKRAIEELYKFPIVSIFIFSPLLFFLVVFLSKDSHLIFESSFFNPFFIWGAGSLLICFFTSFEKTKFLGQAERYGDYSVFALVTIIPIYIYQFHNSRILWFTLAAVVIYNLVLYAISLYVWLYIYPSLKNLNLAVDKLKSLESKNIACIPINLSYQIAYQTDHKLLFHPPGFGNHIKKFDKDLQRYNKLYFKYPLLNTNLQKLSKDYGIQILVAKKKYAFRSVMNAKNIDEIYDFSTLCKIYENDEYYIYEKPLANYQHSHLP